VQALGSLGVGQSRVVEFAVIANIPGDQLMAKLGFSVLEGERRIGLLDDTRRVPVRNEYRISVTKGKETLRNATLSRLSYTVRNVSSDALFKSLQVSARVESTNSADFEIVGPNPQLLSPVNRGQETSFTVPVMVKSTNGGGVVILEVREDGRVVVVHRLRF
jgi:hypothetical protein